MIYRIIGDKFKPNIEFDPEKGILEISEYAILESETEYLQIRNWIDEFFSLGKNSIIVIFKVKYINSLAVKLFTKLLISLRKRISDALSVEWHYYDEDIIDNILDIESVTGVNIKKIANIE